MPAPLLRGGFGRRGGILRFAAAHEVFQEFALGIHHGFHLVDKRIDLGHLVFRNHGNHAVARRTKRRNLAVDGPEPGLA